MAPFMGMYLLWGIETMHRSRFAVNSKLHKLLDLSNNLLLIISASNMKSVQTYR